MASFYDNNYTVTVNVDTARREMLSARADIMQSIFENDTLTTQKMIDEASDHLSTMRETFPVIRSKFKGDKSLIDDVEDILKDAIVYRDKVFELSLTNEYEDAYKVLKDNYVPLLDKMADKLQNIADAAEKMR